jgi:hypothetical protein
VLATKGRFKSSGRFAFHPSRLLERLSLQLVDTAQVSTLRAGRRWSSALIGAIFLSDGLGRRRVAAALALAGGCSSVDLKAQ